MQLTVFVTDMGNCNINVPRKLGVYNERELTVLGVWRNTLLGLLTTR